MIVKNFDTKIVDNRKQVSAQIEWETANRPQEEIYFEVEKKHEEKLSCNKDAFFLSTIIPAIHYGENRYVIDGEVCPMLKKGVQEALAWIYYWHDDIRPDQFKLEVETRAKPKRHSNDRNSAWFLSGGIDSYSSFFNNRSEFSEEHPAYFKDGILGFGLETASAEKFDYVLMKLKEAAKKMGVNLIPIYTNAYLVYRQQERAHHHELWLKEFQGAFLSALAHALVESIHSITIPSGRAQQSLVPFGTHPLIDHHYSSQGLNVWHDDNRFNRLEKTKIVADNLPSSFPLRVCNDFTKYDKNHLNCGQCEKCTRTMLAFLAIGKLDGLNAFPFNDISREMIIKNVKLRSDSVILYYRQLIPSLREAGRDDLVEAIEYSIKRYRRNKLRGKVKSNLKTFDKNYLSGNTVQLKRKFLHTLNVIYSMFDFF